MVWESSSEDAFGFQDANGATTADQTQINIVDSTHPAKPAPFTQTTRTLTAVSPLNGLAVGLCRRRRV